MISDSMRLSLAEDVTFQSVGDGKDTVILSLSSGYLYTCNETTARFLSHLDGRRTFGEIIGALGQEFEVPLDKLRADMAGLAERLIQEKLIVDDAPGQSPQGR